MSHVLLGKLAPHFQIMEENAVQISEIVIRLYIVSFPIDKFSLVHSILRQPAGRTISTAFGAPNFDGIYYS